MNNMAKLVVTLTVIGIISALVLAFVYQWTTPYINKHKVETKKEAVLTVIPDAAEYKKIEKKGKTFYEGFNKNGDRVGVAVITKGPGFQGIIKLMVGTNPQDGKIYGIKILSHQETPGLGARITGDEYKSNFKEKPFGEYKVVKKETDDPYQVEAISGATISSTKVTNIIEKAVAEIKSAYGGGS